MLVNPPDMYVRGDFCVHRKIIHLHQHKRLSGGYGDFSCHVMRPEDSTPQAERISMLKNVNGALKATC